MVDLARTLARIGAVRNAVAGVEEQGILAKAFGENIGLRLGNFQVL